MSANLFIFIPAFSLTIIIIIINIVISGFGIYGAAVVPDSGVGNTWQTTSNLLLEACEYT